MLGGQSTLVDTLNSLREGVVQIMATIDKFTEDIAGANVVLDGMAAVTKPASTLGSIRGSASREIDRVGRRIHEDCIQSEVDVTEVGVFRRRAMMRKY